MGHTCRICALGTVCSCGCSYQLRGMMSVTLKCSPKWQWAVQFRALNCSVAVWGCRTGDIEVTVSESQMATRNIFMTALEWIFQTRARLCYSNWKYRTVFIIIYAGSSNKICLLGKMRCSPFESDRVLVNPDNSTKEKRSKFTKLTPNTTKISYWLLLCGVHSNGKTHTVKDWFVLPSLYHNGVSYELKLDVINIYWFSFP